MKRAPEVIQLFQALRKSAMAFKSGGSGGGRRGSDGGGSVNISAAPSAGSLGGGDPNDLLMEINSKSGHATKVDTLPAPHSLEISLTLPP